MSEHRDDSGEVQPKSSSKVTLTDPEITRVSPPSCIEFHYHCSLCGQIENRIKLEEIVTRNEMRALMNLQVQAHLRTH